jgi:hypothetical protein
LLSLRARPLASLGAAITILALAFDPFIQQILQYSSLPYLDSQQESSVLRTSKFAIEPFSADWLKAVDTGIRSNPEQYAQKPSCSSGNCTWAEYSTTGWCSKCQDAMPYVKLNDCDLSGYNFDVDPLNRTGSCSIDFGHGDTVQVLSPPQSIYQNNTGFNTQSYTYNVSTLSTAVVWPLGLLNSNYSMPLDNKTYAGATNPIVALGNVHLKRCNEVAEFSGLDEGLCITYAEECVLSLCTTLVETSVENGTPKIAFNDEDYGCLSQAYNESREYYDSDSLCWQAGKLCTDPNSVNNTPTQTQSSSPLISDFCSDGIIVQNRALSDSDNSDPSPRLSNVQGKLLTRLTGNQSARWIIGDKGGFREGYTQTSSFSMEYIIANGLEPVLAEVAPSLTHQALLANTSVEEIGAVWTIETFVAVDWPWLIYPAMLVLSSIVLLALTALHSHRCGLRTWKSSILPLLYRTLDPDLLARRPVLHDVSTMTGVAGGAKVTLVETSREDGVVLTSDKQHGWLYWSQQSPQQSIFGQTPTSAAKIFPTRSITLNVEFKEPVKQLPL